jgi:hypothetical protein
MYFLQCLPVICLWLYVVLLQNVIKCALCCVFNWPYSCWLSRSIIKNWTELLFIHGADPFFLEKPPVVQLFKNFLEFRGNRRFISMFTRVLQWSLCWASQIQPIHPHSLHLRSILLLSHYVRLNLRGGLFPSRFSIETLHEFLVISMRATC